MDANGRTEEETVTSEQRERIDAIKAALRTAEGPIERILIANDWTRGTIAERTVAVIEHGHETEAGR